MTFLILSSIPIQSGTGIRISNIARSLAEKGHKVVMTGIGPRPEGLEEVRYIKIPQTGNRALSLLVSMAVNSVAAMMEKPDVLFSSKTLPNSVLPTLFCSGKRIIKVLDLDDLESGYWAGTWLEPFLKFTDRLFVRFFHKIAVHTEELRQYALKNLGVREKNLIFLKQGVRFSLFQKKCGDARKRLGLEEKRIILYTAHLGIAAKGGLEFLFRGCREVLLEREDAILLVVGSGDRVHQYKLTVSQMGLEGKVVFVGGARYEEMPDYFSSADVSVNYLEDSEANRCRSSIKVRESLAAGVPVVCNAVGSDLVQFLDYIYAYPTGSVEGFAEKLNEALFRPDNKRIEAGKKFVGESWDWNFVISGFIEGLKEIK